MYIPTLNQMNDRAEALAFMQHYSFATLVSIVSRSDNGHDEPFATHLPFVVRSEENGRIVLQAHCAKANPHWKAFDERPVLVIFQGSHAYVSPQHYTSEQNVPTWNYTAVHAYGKARIVADAEDILAATIAFYEAQYQTQWNALSERYREGMKAGIVAFEIEVERLEGKYKLSQNRKPDEYERITDYFLQQERTEIRETGEYMRRLSPFG